MWYLSAASKCNKVPECQGAKHHYPYGCCAAGQEAWWVGAASAQAMVFQSSKRGRGRQCPQPQAASMGGAAALCSGSGGRCAAGLRSSLGRHQQQVRLAQMQPHVHPEHSDLPVLYYRLTGAAIWPSHIRPTEGTGRQTAPPLTHSTNQLKNGGCITLAETAALLPKQPDHDS